MRQMTRQSLSPSVYFLLLLMKILPSWRELFLLITLGILLGLLLISLAGSYLRTPPTPGFA